MILILLAEARICTRGFLSTVNDCTGCGFREDNGNVFTRIIPDMNFTCNGTVTYWRAAGGFETGGNRNSVLSIWRERSNEPGTYDRIGRIKLGRCGGERQAQLVMGMNNVYECTLPQSEWVTYQHGDIVGIELFTASDVRFRLYFNSIGGSRNYIFTGKSSHPNNVELNNHEDTETQDLPQISLTKQPPSTSRMDGDSNSGGGGDTGSQTGTIAGVVICIIVAILLASVIIFLLVFVLRRRKGLKKFTPPVTQSNRATTNPVYDGKQTSHWQEELYVLVQETDKLHP